MCPAPSGPGEQHDRRVARLVDVALVVQVFPQRVSRWAVARRDAQRANRGAGIERQAISPAKCGEPRIVFPHPALAAARAVAIGKNIR